VAEHARKAFKNMQSTGDPMLHAASQMSSIINNIRKDDQDALMAELMLRIAHHKDKTAFTKLLEIMGPRLKGFMINRGLNAEMAEDLAQETLIRVWHKAGTYNRGKGLAVTWIFTIARNLHIDSARRNKIVQFTELGDYDCADEAPESDVAMIGNQQASLVSDAVKQLPAEQREIIEMAFMQDLSQSDIAEKTGLPLGTVKSRMRLAYKKLNRSLGEL